MITKKQISAAILARTGYSVGIGGTPEDGCYYYYSDDDRTQDMLYGLNAENVYVYRINQMTLRQWVDDFVYKLEVKPDVWYTNNEFVDNFVHKL